MWKGLGLFGIVTMSWWGLLWLIFPRMGWLNWQSISPTAILLMHIGPPAALSAGLRVWARVKEARARVAALKQEEDAETERQTSRDAAHEAHLAALRERQAVVSCRWLWARALPVKDEPAWLAELADGCHWSVWERDEIDAGEVMGALQTPVVALLNDLYAAAPGAAWLPMFVEVIPSVAGVEQLAAFKSWQVQAQAEVLGEAACVSPDCRFLPGSGGMADRVRQLLLQDPELPGVLLLAADAPLALQDEEEDWSESDPAEQARRRWAGRPGAALVAMLFLRDDLPPAEAGLVAEEVGADPYQPYWEKDLSRSYGNWGVVPASKQPSLAALPKLASLAQASTAVLEQGKALQLARQMQPLLDNALVNACLLDYPFCPEDAKPENDQATSLAWLVHNSGEIEVGGVRLAAMASALSRHEVELHPIDEASNVVREWGDVGAAASLLLAAVAVSHCARLQAPTVLTQFSNDYVAVAMARPVLEEESA